MTLLASGHTEIRVALSIPFVSFACSISMRESIELLSWKHFYYIKNSSALRIELYSKESLDQKKYDKQIAGFSLSQLPGCCGVCVSHGSFVYYDYRNKGLGKILNKMRIEIAREMGFGTLMCTDRNDNIPQKKILKANGWKDVHGFSNPRTSNKIDISIIDLTT